MRISRINKAKVETVIAHIPQFEGAEVSQLKDSSIGCDQEVCIATLAPTNAKIVLKVPREEPEKVYHEVIGCQRAQRFGVPVPTIYYYDDEVLVQECLEGQSNLDRVLVSRKQMNMTYRELGRYLKLIHCNEARGYGKIRNIKEHTKPISKGRRKPQKRQNTYFPLIGEDRDMTKSLAFMREDVSKLQELNYYSSKFTDKIKSYISKNQHILFKKQNQSCLLHGDLSEDNIMIKMDEKSLKVTGLIDFGDLSVGSAMEDFARMFVKHHGTQKWEGFLEGYGQHDLEEIKFYALRLCLWQIYGNLVQGKIRGKVRRLQKAIKAIID